MQEPSFFWYDFETFGLDTRRDRPSQFAGRRTTLTFEPLGQEVVIYNQSSRDYLPSPESCVLTKITPQECQVRGLPENEFAQRIWQEVNTPNTVSLGYNTLGFDDEALRFLFWRNFLDPYSHQWAQDCSRWDIYPLVCAVWALRGNDIRWPEWEKMDPTRYPQAVGKTGISFKLEHLTQANGLLHDKAHDAMSDVQATIQLAKLIAEKEPRLWQWAFANRKKATVSQALQQGPVLWVNPRFGQRRGFMKIVQMLAVNTRNRNEVYVWDLGSDPSEIHEETSESLQARLFPTREAREAGVKPLPIYRLPVNASPFVCGDLRVLRADRAERFGVNVEAALANAAKIPELKSLFEGALKDFDDREKDFPPQDIDQALYEIGFLSKEDQDTRATIRKLSPEDLTERISGGRLFFKDDRLNDLLWRYRARNWEASLTPEEQKRWATFVYERLLTGVDPQWRTVTAFMEEIDQLMEAISASEGGLDDAQSEVAEVLEQLYEWGEIVGERAGEAFEEASAPLEHE